MNITPKQIILIASLIALDIAENKTTKEINSYKNLFNAIANNLQAYCNQLIFADKK